jgi:hypothetical protein
MGRVSGEAKQNLAFANINSVQSAHPVDGRAARAPPDAV